MRLLGLVLVLALAVGCAKSGGNNDGGGGAPPPAGNGGAGGGTGGGGTGGGGGKPSAQDCENSWGKTVGFYTPNMSISYRTTTTSDMGGMDRTENETIKVLKSDDTEISMKITTGNQSYTMISKKDDFLKTCEKGSAANVPQNIQILEEREEAVTVPAGTFTTRFSKMKATDSQNGVTTESISNTWSVLDTGLLVKMEIDTVSTMNGQTFKVKLSKVLTSITK